MSIDPIEAMADAIMKFEGWRPGLPAYTNRNPGNLRASLLAAGPGVDGFVRFQTFETGYSALIRDLRRKFTGRSSSGLKATDTLLRFFEVSAPSSDANHPLSYAQFVAGWLTKALQRPIHTDTMLVEIAPDLER